MFKYIVLQLQISLFKVSIFRKKKKITEQILKENRPHVNGMHI